MSLGQVMIFVSSLDNAKAFYTEYIGLEISHDMSSEGMLIMKNDSCYLTIHEKFNPRAVDRHDCRVVPIFKVANIHETRKKLQDGNIVMIGEIEETPVHKYQMLKDPDGNWIEVAQFKH